VNVRDRIVAALDRHERVAIAVSGGVDSMTLAHIAARDSRASATMYHAASPAVPVSARERVEAHAAHHGWQLVVVDAQELADARYRANPIDRCYYCKTNLYDRIASVTSDTIASGTNCDDLSDFRPGLRAAQEHDVVHPYVEAGATKRDIYELAQALGLADVARLPAQPCLASRVETGIAIDPADLAFVDAVEAKLASKLGGEATVRCRVTHRGIVIEIGDASRTAEARAIALRACADAGRPFVGVRPYARGAAFLHKVAT
jgi:pyridinium-3,5-biscarboxylic acid mononucleotide sulfurtransferase